MKVLVRLGIGVLIAAVLSVGIFRVLVWRYWREYNAIEFSDLQEAWSTSDEFWISPPMSGRDSYEEAGRILRTLREEPVLNPEGTLQGWSRVQSSRSRELLAFLQQKPQSNGFCDTYSTGAPRRLVVSTEAPAQICIVFPNGELLIGKTSVLNSPLGWDEALEGTE